MATRTLDSIGRAVLIHNGRVYPADSHVHEPKQQCAYCGTFWGISTHPSARTKRFDDGRPYCDATTCKACGITQCMSNGLARGQCGYCHVGLLPGWSGSDRKCGYTGCEQPAIAAVSRVGFACGDHIGRDKASASMIDSAKALLASLL